LAKNLVIVESPTKSKTLAKFLGKDFTIKASVGHVLDLPKSKLASIWKTAFNRLPGDQGQSADHQGVKDAAAKSKAIYLAPDPDREGERLPTILPRNWLC